MAMDDWRIFTEAGDIFMHSKYKSVNNVAKRMRLRDGETLARVIKRLESQFGTQFVTNGERLTLTKVGVRFHKLFKQLFQIGADIDAEPVEALTIELDAIVARYIVPLILPAFISNWRGQVSIKLRSLDAGQVRANIAAQITAFGVGIANEGGDPIEPGFSWYLVAPKGVKCSGAEKMSDLLDGQRQPIFLPPFHEQPQGEGVDKLLRRTPVSDRFELTSSQAVYELVEQGLGYGLIPGLVIANEEALHDRLPSWPVPELAPLHLTLHLPRDSENISDAAEFLVAQFRDAIARLAGQLTMNKPTQEMGTQVADEEETALEESIEVDDGSAEPDAAI